MKKILAVFLLTLGLGACVTGGPVQVEPIPEITFKHVSPMTLDVASVEIINRRDKKPGVAYVGQRFPTSPQKALENWVRERLAANGSSGTARVIIFDASAIEEKLEKETGFKGLITDDQAEKYTASLNVRIEFDGLDARAPGFVNTNVSRRISINESATLRERELVWFELVEKMMIDFDQRITGELIQKQFVR